MQLRAEGIVVKERNIGENDKILTILTRELGLIEVSARGIRKIKSGIAGSLSIFSYASLDLFKGRGGYIVNSAAPIKSFYGLSGDIEKTYLAFYLCEIICTFLPNEENGGIYLRLLLNTLHYLENGAKNNDLLKGIFELKIMQLSGFMPDLVACKKCCCYECSEMFFLAKSGSLLCGDCLAKGKGAPFVTPIHNSALTGLRFVIFSEFEKIFSFQLTESALASFSRVCEEYLLLHTQKNLSTLDFYKKIKA